MSTEPPVPTDEQILGALDRTGYMFEQRVAGLLGEDVSTGWAFKDQDTGASREIDIHKAGHVSTRRNQRLLHIDWTILGECKNYQWPWVALTKPWEINKSEWDYNSSTDIMLSLAARIDLNGDRALAFEKQDQLLTHYRHSRFRNPRRAVQLVKLNKKSGGWEAHSGDIFNDVTYPLAKAVTFLRDQFDRRYNTSDADYHERRISLVFPAIFVSSPIYAVFVAGGKPAVNPTSHVILERRLSSESISGDFRFDVVHVDGIVDWYHKIVLGTVRRLMTGLKVLEREIVDSKGLDRS